jgi:hypothetical protein
LREAGAAAYRPQSPEDVQRMVRQVSPMLSRSQVNVRVVKAARGGKHAELLDGFQNVIMARTNPDGTVSHRCVDSEEEAALFLSAQTQGPAPAKPEMR